MIVDRLLNEQEWSWWLVSRCEEKHFASDFYCCWFAFWFLWFFVRTITGLFFCSSERPSHSWCIVLRWHSQSQHNADWTPELPSVHSVSVFLTSFSPCEHQIAICHFHQHLDQANRLFTTLWRNWRWLVCLLSLLKLFVRSEKHYLNRGLLGGTSTASVQFWWTWSRSSKPQGIDPLQCWTVISWWGVVTQPEEAGHFRAGRVCLWIAWCCDSHAEADPLPWRVDTCDQRWFWFICGPVERPLWASISYVVVFDVFVLFLLLLWMSSSSHFSCWFWW